MDLFTNKIYMISIGYFLVLFVFSLMVNALFLRFFKTLGIRNHTDGTIIRWGATSKPAVGGITFYIMFLLSVASYSILFEPSQQIYQMGFVGLLLACAAGFIIGLADDAYDTRPLLKFGIQFLSGLILIASGIYIKIFPYQPLNFAFTLFWVVGIMNSVNMLDNMDGITSIVTIGIIANTIYRIFSHSDFNNMHLLVLIGVLSSVIAFLRFNWHPSKMYMGDTGSQFLGVFLAAMGIIYFWNDPYASLTPATGKLFCITLMTFILPILDTTIVVVNRLSKGQSPFVGGKDHTTHSLAYLGLSDRQVALVFLALAACSLSLNIMISEILTEWNHLYTALFAGYFLMLLTFFFYTTRNKKAKSRERLHKIRKITPEEAA
jgi:UDP-GlcNAc:undecaprenyl-phosphate/decaprenyl-phosphate GlcNAc-1-phosphate transferase